MVMTTIIIIIILFLCFRTIFFVIKYGKGIINPDFKTVDERFTQKTGFKSSWNTLHGKTIYYIVLSALIIFILLFGYLAIF